MPAVAGTGKKCQVRLSEQDRAGRRPGVLDVAVAARIAAATIVRMIGTPGPIHGPELCVF
jgi:hypothetical protein